MSHSELALFAQRTRIPTSTRSIGFCVIWVCNEFEFDNSPALWLLLRRFILVALVRSSSVGESILSVE